MVFFRCLLLGSGGFLEMETAVLEHILQVAASIEPAAVVRQLQQQLMTTIDYVPTNTKMVSPLRGVKILITDPIQSLDEAEKWSKLFDDTVVSRGGR